jgi:hypothetical protein
MAGAQLQAADARRLPRLCVAQGYHGRSPGWRRHPKHSSISNFTRLPNCVTRSSAATVLTDGTAHHEHRQCRTSRDLGDSFYNVLRGRDDDASTVSDDVYN